MLLSIEIKDEKINIVHALKRGNSISILSCQNINGTFVLSNEKIIDIEETSSKIKEILVTNKIKVKRPIFVINSNSIIIRKLKLPLLNKKSEIVSMIQHELEQSMPVDMSQYKIIYKIVNDECSNKAFYVIYGLPLNLFNQYAELANKLKFKTSIFEIYGNSFNEIIPYKLLINNISVNADDTIAFVDINENEITFSVLKNGVCDFSRTSEFNDYDQDLISETHGDYIVEKGKTTEEFMYRYLNEISKYIRFYHSVDYDNRINRLYFYGAAFNSRLLDFLSVNLSINCISIDSISNVEFGELSCNSSFYINNNLIQLLTLLKNKKDACFCYEQNNYFNILKYDIKVSAIAAVIAATLLAGALLFSSNFYAEYDKMKLFISKDENIKANEKIENLKYDIKVLESAIENINVAITSAQTDDYVSSDILRKILFAVPENTKVISIFIDKESTHLSCVSGSIEEVTILLFNLRKIDFIESTNVPNIELIRNQSGNYSYSVVCKLKDVNKIGN